MLMAAAQQVESKAPADHEKFVAAVSALRNLTAEELNAVSDEILEQLNSSVSNHSRIGASPSGIWRKTSSPNPDSVLRANAGI